MTEFSRFWIRRIFTRAKHSICRKRSACGCASGSHAEAHAQYRKLLDYIEKHQMQMIGFSREITLIDYGITNNTEKFVTELCIPVRCE